MIMKVDDCEEILSRDLVTKIGSVQCAVCSVQRLVSMYKEGQEKGLLSPDSP